SLIPQRIFFFSEIRPVFRSFRKCVVKSNLCAIISPRGEKCGLGLALFHICATLLIAITGSGCATNPVSGNPDFVMMSEDQEIALGRQYHAEILKVFRKYDDPDLQQYVENVVDGLGETSHRQELIYHVTVLDSPEVNAFALPGGYLYITRGIMSYMNSEAQLAGVLGHEIGHVTARHSVRQHATAQGLGLLAMIITTAARTPGVGDLTNVLGTALIRGYGREHELEADRLGAEYLARNEYDPEAMIDVIGILKNQELFEKQRAEEEGREPRVYHGTFSTHPDNDQRLQEVVGAAEQFSEGEPRPDERDAFLRRLQGMVIGPGEYEGVLRGRNFYHKHLGVGISFPEGWKVENKPDRLLASPSDNSALIQVTSQDLNRKEPPADFLRRLHDGRLEGGEEISTADFQGYTGASKVKTPFGRRKARVAAMFQAKRAYIFAAASKDEDAQTDPNDPLYLETIKSLRVLTAEERELAEPRRLNLIETQTGDTFAKLAEDSAFSHHAEEQLRLLNGMYPDGEPEPGQLLKVVK
ncbi:MAG: M48 family metalloprotease, partial [Gammaproteobacteria bacterium]